MSERISSVERGSQDGSSKGCRWQPEGAKGAPDCRKRFHRRSYRCHSLGSWIAQWRGARPRVIKSISGSARFLSLFGRPSPFLARIGGARDTPAFIRRPARAWRGIPGKTRISAGTVSKAKTAANLGGARVARTGPLGARVRRGEQSRTFPYGQGPEKSEKAHSESVLLLPSGWARIRPGTRVRIGQRGKGGARLRLPAALASNIRKDDFDNDWSANENIRPAFSRQRASWCRAFISGAQPGKTASLPGRRVICRGR